MADLRQEWTTRSLGKPTAATLAVAEADCVNRGALPG